MSSTLLSSKGQVVIPKALREARRWGPGTRFEVRETAAGLLLTPVAGIEKKQALTAGLAALRERANYQGPTVTLQQMDAAVADEARRKAQRR